MKNGQRSRYWLALNTALVTTIIGALANIGSSIYTVNINKKQNGLEQLLQLSGHFDKDMRRTRKETAESFLHNTVDPDYDEIMDFYDTVGLLTKRGVLDEELVWSIFFLPISRIFSNFQTLHGK